ncbi:OsmC family protein [Fretibacter rubidus]|uniref:OsmC family protein n=1 Tax=Fretibacter rubidus TaxID=570162 RepID=UPI00352A368C
MTEMVTVSEREGGKYTNDVRTSRHHLYADEPVPLGSSDLGPTPFEYLAAGLGACTTITLRMYADRKKWPLEHVSVDVSQSKDSDGKHVFKRDITVTGDLDDTQRARLKEIANKCPVHKVLHAGSDVITNLT